MTRGSFTLPAITLAFAYVLSACTPTEQSTALGAAGGAVIGAAISSDEDRTKGAIAGLAVGALAGSLIGQGPTSGQCYYSDGAGGRYLAPC